MNRRYNAKQAGPAKGSITPYSYFKKVADDVVALQIFDIIENDPAISQGKIMRKTGLAAGLVHSFMKSVINKGWIRAKQVSPKRWLYFMTPEGFLEKGRITMEFLGRTYHNYRIAHDVVQSELAVCMTAGFRKVVVAGDGSLAEIVIANVHALGNLHLEAVLGREEGRLVSGTVRTAGYQKIIAMEYDRVFVCDQSFRQWAKDNQVDIASHKLVVLLDKISLGMP